MEAIVVVPGTMGTSLILPGSNGQPDEEVWPPTALETQFGYKRREKLASDAVRPGAIIEKVLCFDFYGPLIGLAREAGYDDGSATKRLVRFPYDWRRDLFDIAADLARQLATLHADGARRVVLVGHSMGGLVCRLLLESETWRGEPWFKDVTQFIAVATPHAGAALALARVLGLDSAMGISGKDFAWLADQERWPSGYQLLPAPGEDACWNQTPVTLDPLDIYEAGTAALLGLNPKLLDRVRALHAVLAAGNRPDKVRYFYFASSGHRTVTRVNVFAHAGAIDPARSAVTQTEGAGDGTVPMFSALSRAPQRHVAPNEHATAFKGSAFRAVFLRLLGVDVGPALEAVLGPTLALSVESPVVQAKDDIEVMIYVDQASDSVTQRLDRIDGALVLRRIRRGDAEDNTEVARSPVRYSGPPIDRLQIILETRPEPGHYELRFESATGTPSARAVFSVCAA
jgi:pimeloyl-ACP methyl ester carboxylesterase